ncbi:MAG: hypothetical protein ACQEXJ_21415 [Myxococcota bacterium]
MTLFADQLALRAFSLDVGTSAEQLADKLEILERLHLRRRSGELADLTETRVEQSFNERLFSEVFDYRTLLRDGAGEYHLQPRFRHKRHRYDDFALGFFGPTGGVPVVSCELKSYGTDLDAPQTGGSYSGQTPVEQAHSAVSGPQVRWILLSNFDELRLYRAGDQSRCFRTLLSGIYTVTDFREVYAVFSRKALLGSSPSSSPLDGLHSMQTPSVVPPKKGRIRLLQHSWMSGPDPNVPFFRLEEAMARSPNISIGEAVPKGERLVHEVRDVSGSPELVREASKAGAFRRSQYVELSGAGPGTALQGESLRKCIFGFLCEAHLFYSHLTKTHTTDRREVSVLWLLDGIADSELGAPAHWFPVGIPSLNVRAPSDAESSEYERTGLLSIASVNANESKFEDLAYDAMRELLFPFVARVPGTSQRTRVTPRRK